MKNDNGSDKLDVLLVGVTDRAQSINAALGILKESRHHLSCVIFQKRFSKRATSMKFYQDLITKFGFRFIKFKIAELIKLKLKSAPEGKKFHQIIKSKNIEYHEVDDVNSESVKRIIERNSPDAIVLSGAPIIKKNILNCARKCTINIHRSLLPKYAGLDAIFWALYHDENTIGATVHTVNERIDAGKIILQAERQVLPEDNVETLTTWYYGKVSELFVEALNLICEPGFTPKEQDFSQRSYFSWPTKVQRKELERKLKKRKSKEH